ncbi:Holliday junction resolvase RuvX, partial [Loktanella salsilacus]
MICEDVSSFLGNVPAFGALAGLDLGTVTIGVAVSDVMRGVATPTETIKRKKFGLDA